MSVTYEVSHDGVNWAETDSQFGVEAAKYFRKKIVRDAPLEQSTPRTPQPGDVWRYGDAEHTLKHWLPSIQGWRTTLATGVNGLLYVDRSGSIPSAAFVRAADAPEASKPGYVEAAEERKRLFKQAVKELEEAVAASKVPHGPTCSCWTCEKDRLYITKEREAKIAAEMTTVNASYQESERQRRDKEAIKRNMVGPMNFGGLTMGWDKRGRR
jgi:hypothetical protein